MTAGRVQPLLARLGAMALAGLLSACAARTDAPVEAAAPPPVAIPRVEAPPPEAPVNRVAVLVPMTGSNAAVGQSIANAARLALIDIGQAKLKLTVYDTAGLGAANAAQRALNEGNRLFLGPLLAPDVRAVQPIAAAAGVPILSFSNDETLAGSGTYVMGFQPGQSVARVVGYARSRGVERFAALVPAGVYGQRASNAFVKAVRDSGGRVVAMETFTRDPKKLANSVRRVTDYEARVARASQGGTVRADGTVAPVGERIGPVAFQALLIADSGSVAAAIAPSLAQYGASGARLLGPELWSAEPGIAAKPAMRGAWFASVPDARFNQMASRYAARFGGRPSRLASMGYDAVLLAHSLADRWPVGAAFPRAALSDPDGFVGLDGVFRFAASGVAERGLEVQQVGNGGFTTVSPAPARLSAPASAAVN